MTELEFRVAWMKTGGWAGLIGVTSYFAAAFLPLPDGLAYLLAFAFGPLLAVGAVGLYHGLTVEHRTPVDQIATLLAVCAGVSVLQMLAVQQAVFARTGTAPSLEPSTLAFVQGGLNAVHFGLDIAWDVLISAAVMLYGVAMLGRRAFGAVLGAAAIGLGGLLLGFNLWFFPTPPAAAGALDFGPFVALWLVAAFAQLLRAARRLHVQASRRRGRLIRPADSPR